MQDEDGRERLEVDLLGRFDAEALGGDKVWEVLGEGEVREGVFDGANVRGL